MPKRKALILQGYDKDTFVFIGISGQDQAESESHEPQQTPPKKPGDKKGGGGAVIREKPSAKQTTPLPKPEVKPNEPS